MKTDSKSQISGVAKMPLYVSSQLGAEWSIQPVPANIPITGSIWFNMV
jgi:hypothetical protein